MTTAPKLSPAVATISAADLRARVAAGERIEDMARAYGVHRSTIKRRAKMLEIDLPAVMGPPRRTPPIEDLIARIKAGETAASIARSAGVSHSAIPKSLERAGYRLRGGTITKLDTEVQS